MRLLRAAPHRLAWALLGAIVVAAAPASVRAAPPEDAAGAASELGAPRWEVRRAAERALEAEGMAALSALAEDGSGRERLDAWASIVEKALESAGQGATDALLRVLRRVETRATDDQVRRVPHLLKARLARMLPQIVVEVPGPDGVPLRVALADASTEDDAAKTAAVAVRGLFPEANGACIDLVRTSRAPRTIAGAIVALCGDDGQGPKSDAVYEALVAAWSEDPARVASIAGFEGEGRTSPIAALGVALALSGRARDLAQLRGRVDLDTSGAFSKWLGSRLMAGGQGDLTIGTFVQRMEEGRVSAAFETDAARRALDARLPWLARLLARRGLFLDPSSVEARRVLVEADRAVGLLATARIDAGGAKDGPETDVPEAASVDEALRGGRLSQRLLCQLNAGDTPAPGLVPAAAADGVLVHATTAGRVVRVDPATGEAQAQQTAGINQIPRSVAISGGVLAAVTRAGALYLWRLRPDGLQRMRTTSGRYAVVTAGRGDLWLVDEDRRVFRSHEGGAPQQVGSAPTVTGFAPRTLAMLDDGTLLVANRVGAVLIDTEKGAVTDVASGEDGELEFAAFGADVLVARGSTFEWRTVAGAVVGHGEAPDGARIVGIAGDASTRTVFLTLTDATLACDAKDGTVRWLENVGGSGSAVVGDGFVVVPAGRGLGEHGDDRTERTFSVLRASVGGLDPFGTEERVRAVDVAVAAAGKGELDVAESLMDLVLGWLSPVERWGAVSAIGEAKEKARRAGLLPKEPDEPGDPTPVPDGPQKVADPVPDDGSDR